MSWGPVQRWPSEFGSKVGLNLRSSDAVESFDCFNKRGKVISHGRLRIRPLVLEAHVQNGKDASRINGDRGTKHDSLDLIILII